LKILVVSDTHVETKELEKLLIKYADEVKIVCHLGDHAIDLLMFTSEYPQLRLVAVSGNCDYGSTPSECLLEFSPCLDGNNDALTRILLVHGHNHGVKFDLDRLAYYAKEKGASAAFYGHTHYPVMTTHGGIFIMNPGSPSFPRGGSSASYGLVEVSPEGAISGKLINI